MSGIIVLQHVSGFIKCFYERFQCEKIFVALCFGSRVLWSQFQARFSDMNRYIDSIKTFASGQ